MSDLGLSELREHLADAIDSVRQSGEPVYITRRGKRVAVVVDAESYDRLIAEAEDQLDRHELRTAREEDDYVPWDEVKRELGLA
jgi:prevent-host-death family protein